jgi:hypothetical protein
VYLYIADLHYVHGTIHTALMHVGPTMENVSADAVESYREYSRSLLNGIANNQIPPLLYEYLHGSFGRLFLHR